MAWLITQSDVALNLEHVNQIHASKDKVKAVVGGIPTNVAVDLPPDVAPRLVREIVVQVALGYSVEVIGHEVRRISDLR